MTHRLTVLFADISKSSSIYELLGDQAAQKLIGEILDLFQKIAIRDKGKVIKRIGDAVMCTYDNVENAVQSAMAMQEAMNLRIKENPDNPRINIHIGLQHGTVIVEKDDVYGEAVNLAARLVDYAKPRQIITTSETLDKLQKYYKKSSKYIGKITAKNISGEIEIYEIVWEKQELTMAINRSKQMVKPDLRLELSTDEKKIIINSQNPVISIGRHDMNDVVINYSWISRVHATIEYRKGIFIIVDKSTNGTFIYAHESQPVHLNMGEQPLTGSGIIIMGRERSDEVCKDKLYYRIH